MNVKNYPFSESFFQETRKLISRSNGWVIVRHIIVRYI